MFYPDTFVGAVDKNAPVPTYIPVQITDEEAEALGREKERQVAARRRKLEARAAKKARKKERRLDQASQPKEQRSQTPSKEMKQEFYRSWEWTRLRMEVLKQYGRECMCCGARPGNGVVIHVDHIKPLHTHWHLRLDRTNLQVLCNTCNQGKGAWDSTDYRPDVEVAEEEPTPAELMDMEFRRIVN